jgi:MFS family permease
MNTLRLIYRNLTHPVAHTDHEAITHLGMRDTVFNSLMVGFGEIYIIAFAIAMGFPERMVGFLAVVPLVIGALFNLVSSRYLLRDYTSRQWVVLCTLGQSLSLFLLGLLGLLRPSPEQSYWVVPTFFVFTTLYWSSGQACGPAWNAWIGVLVPSKSRLLYFARRNRIAQFTTLMTLVVTGLILKKTGALHQEMLIFSLLLFVASLSRLGSTLSLLKHPDAPRTQPTALGKRDQAPLNRWLFSFPVLIILLFNFATNVGVNFANPFMAPYMLKQLSLSYSDYTILTASLLLSRALTAGSLSRLGNRFGIKFLVMCGVIGIIPLSWAWTLSTSMTYLIMLQFVSGFIWGCHELGLTLYLMEIIPHQERSRLLSWNSIFNTAGMLTGSMGATAYIGSVAMTAPIYYDVFTISSLLRLLPLPLLAYWFWRSSQSSFVKTPQMVLTPE